MRFKEFSDTSIWNKRKIGDEMYIKARIGWQSLTKDEYTKTGEYYLITGTDFRSNNRIDFDKCYYVSKKRYEMDNNIQLKIGDILVTKDGTIGKIAYIDRLDKPATLNSHLFVLRDLSNKILNKYLLYVLLSNVFSNFVNSIKTGSTLTGLPQKDMIRFEYGYPHIEEQQKIADFLSLIDQRIETQSKIIEVLKSYKLQISDKFLYNINNEYVKLSKLATLKNGYAFKSIDYDETGLYSVITISSVQGNRYIDINNSNKINKLPNDIQSHQKLEQDDILISMTGNVGRVSICNYDNCLLNQRVGVLSIIDKNDREYIYQCLSTGRFEQKMIQKGQGAAQLNIGKDDIESFLIPKNIDNNIIKLLSTIDKKICCENLYWQKLKEQKKYLLSNMFI